MKNKIIELLVALMTGITCWLALSYIFFPIKLAAPADEYFTATITHMVPLKLFITIVFVLFALFVYGHQTKNE